jgi:hypothetical protein
MSTSEQELAHGTCDFHRVGMPELFGALADLVVQASELKKFV